MLAPLNTVQRHPLLHQLPQWTQLSQKTDPLRHGFQHVVDFALGRESPDAESDAAVCALVAVSEGAKNVAGFEGCGGAGAPG